MQALGNDFMVIDTLRQSLDLTPELIKKWGERRTGIGFDQLLLLEPATNPQADFIYRIFNADGTEVEQCGNGARCVARFIFEQKLSIKKQLLLQTKQGLLHTELIALDWVKVSLGMPQIEVQPRLMEIDNHLLEVGVLSLGNPHAVICVADVATADVAKTGAKIETDASFAEGVNVGFMEIINSKEIKLRVWERGVGETPACGSGASAAVVIGQQKGKLAAEVEVHLPGGKLYITHLARQPVYLTGPAQQVFTGRVFNDK